MKAKPKLAHLCTLPGPTSPYGRASPRQGSAAIVRSRAGPVSRRCRAMPAPQSRKGSPNKANPPPAIQPPQVRRGPNNFAISDFMLRATKYFG